MTTPVIYNKWALAVAPMWALIAYMNYSPAPESTLPKYFWVVNLACAILFFLSAFRKTKSEDI